MEWKIKEKEDRLVPGDSAMQLRGHESPPAPDCFPAWAQRHPPLKDPGIWELWAQSKFLDINGSTEEQ